MRQRVRFSSAAAIGAVVSVTIAGVALSALTGPSTAQSPYVLPAAPGVETTSLLSVGDTVGAYRMVGLPDGLGAFDNGDDTFTLVMNHEIVNPGGVIRAHGGRSAFVSKWTIEKDSMSVLSGTDLMQRVYMWNTAAQASETVSTNFSFTRFCSGDLPAVSAFYNPQTGLGTQARIYMHGEEGGATGWQLGSVVTGPEAGNTYALGKFNLTTNGSGLTGVGAWENALANPYPQDTTIVIANSDGGTGIMTNAVAVYVGKKQKTGSEVEKAGLMNGSLRFVNVVGNPAEIVNATTRATNITSGMRFTLSATASTTFSRPEDGAWDPADPRQFYFVTTDQLDQVTDGVGAQIGRTRMWRLTFDNLAKPFDGGTIDLVIDGRMVGTERVNMFDNITINAKSGVIVLLEDVGNAAHNGKVWLYNPATDELTKIAKHDSARFGDIGVPATTPFNQDEETSGVIDMSSILGPGMYLTSDQAHYLINAANPRGFSNPDELVEGGQLLSLRVPYPVATEKNACKGGGWEGMFRTDGTTFKNQGDCIQYVNTGK